MPYAEVNGQRIHFEDTGGGGPTVLFSHGFLMDLEMFAPQVEALRDRFRCISWDERGFGQTESDGKPFSYWDSAEDAVGLLDHLGLDRAGFVGMSQGGFLGLRAALRHPDRVAALALIDTRCDGHEEGAVEGYEGLFAEVTANGMHEGVAGIVASILFGPGFADRRYWIGKWRSRPASSWEPAFRCLVELDDISDRMAEVTCPALVVHGDADAAIPPVRGEELRDRLPASEGPVVVPGAGHTSNLEEPGLVNPPLREFLDRHLA